MGRKTMKTLDEVIRAYECCQNVECDECPFKILFNDDSHVPCDQFSKDEDALHYLKEYREVRQILQDTTMKLRTRIDELEAWQKERQEIENPALTWDELRQMEGKPVWVEEKYSFSDEWHGQWEVISSVLDDEYYDAPTLSMTNEEYRHKEDMGKLWQAYRKERK